MMLSIVTTLYQSAASIEEFHRRATAAALALTADYEIIMVDDGSEDDSLTTACRLLEHDPRLRIIELSRNFGHHRAMMAGLEAATGEHIFLIDVDLEEDPAWLERFWRELHSRNADVVYGQQVRRKGRPLERIGGALHWWIIRMLSSYEIPENLVTARLMTRQYVQALLLHREQKTAIGGLWAITGFRQVGLTVAKGFRGRSSYTLGQRMARGFDGITSFSEKPLILVFVLGGVIMAVSFMGGAYLIVRRLTGTLPVAGYASLIVSIWMLGGLCIASIGLVGLYTSRIFVETKRRPYVIVRGIHERERTDS
jgi:putative glycosyltransferase